MLWKKSIFGSYKSGLCRDPEWISKVDGLANHSQKVLANIQHISGVDNIVADTLNRLPSMQSEKYQSCESKDQCRTYALFAISGVKNNKDCFPLNILILQREQQIKLRNIDSKLGTYILNQWSGYSMKSLIYANIICYDSRIYMPQILRRRVLYW